MFIRKKDMSFLEIYNKKSISLLGDADKDNIPNVLDCKPFDPNRDGLFGRAVNIISLGKYGQSKEDFQAERTSNTHFERNPKTGKVIQMFRNGVEVNPNQKSTDQLIREYNENKVKERLENLKTRNDIIKQNLEIQKLKQKERLLSMQYNINRGPSTAQQAFSIVMGIPQPKTQGLPFRTGYYIEKEPPKLPKGYKWKKASKSKSNSAVCPNCNIPMMLMPSFMGQPVLTCPNCGLVL